MLAECYIFKGAWQYIYSYFDYIRLPNEMEPKFVQYTYVGVVESSCAIACSIKVVIHFCSLWLGTRCLCQHNEHNM